MNDIVYSFYGKDILMNVCILIKSFIKLLQDKFIKDLKWRLCVFISQKHIILCRIQKVYFGWSW